MKIQAQGDANLVPSAAPDFCLLTYSLNSKKNILKNKFDHPH